MKNDPPSEFSDLESTLGFQFKNKDFLREALTHRSYLNERPSWHLPHNERLEYLGDAVLELIVTEELFRNFKEASEGQMTVFRAALVNYQMLSKVARAIELENFILMSKGERRDKGKAREVILANALESLVGAIYLDQGMEGSRRFVDEFILVHLEDIIETQGYKDPKSELQEIIQEKKKVTPTYKVLKETGPAHRRRFDVGVYFGEEMITKGAGDSKHEAEVAAAMAALKKFKKPTE